MRLISADPCGGCLVQFSTTGPGWKCSHQSHRGTDLFTTHATFLPPVTHLYELLSALACPMPTPSQPCRSLQGFHKTWVTFCWIPGPWMLCSPISTIVAEHSPLLGSVLRSRLQDPGPDETENNMDKGCLSQKIYSQMTLKGEELNKSRQKSKQNTETW